MVGHVGEVVDRRRDKTAQPVGGEPLGGAVDGKDATDPRVVRARVRELLDEGRLDLLEAVVELDLAGERDALPAREPLLPSRAG